MFSYKQMTDLFSSSCRVLLKILGREQKCFSLSSTHTVRFMNWLWNLTVFNKSCLS